MKKFNIEFFVPIIPALAVIASALLAAVITTIFSFFCSSVNIANAHSNAFSSSPAPPPSSSPLQSQQQQRHHQPLLNTNGIMKTSNNLNEQQEQQHHQLPLSQQQQMIHQPSVISSPVKSLLPQQQQQQQNQQQQNQLSNQQQPQPLLNTNGTSDINTPANRLPTSAPPLSFRTEFPEPLCYFNADALFCPHYLWHPF
jgi:TolA-binding protein